MAGFIDTMRSEGYAAWSICRVLREQGCQVAARSYRSRATARSGSEDDHRGSRHRHGPIRRVDRGCPGPAEGDSVKDFMIGGK
jgi:hypothetical protein